MQNKCNNTIWGSVNTSYLCCCWPLFQGIKWSFFNGISIVAKTGGTICGSLQEFIESSFLHTGHLVCYVIPPRWHWHKSCCKIGNVLIASNYKFSLKDILILNWWNFQSLVNFIILDPLNFIKLHFQNYFKLDTIPKKRAITTESNGNWTRCFVYCSKT